MPDKLFTDACQVVIPFGKYKGRTIASVGRNDEGLRYLDWLVGQPWLRQELKVQVEVYLHHPSVALGLEAALDGRD